MRLPVLCVFATLVIPQSGRAETVVPTKVTSVEGISEYRFDNGLKVLLFPDPSKPTVTVSMTIFVGSRHEGYGEAGMAHLLEHMLFKGTPDHPEIPKVLKERGARFNGTTWYDRTNYYETLPASDQNLEFAIRLEADRLINSYVKAEDLESEMTVVRNEFESGENNPSGVLRQRMMSAAFDWHNYGKSTIGNRADIERVPIDNLKAFYKKHYQPDNAMVVIAGSFDEERALELVGEHFGSLPRPERTLTTTYTEEPAQDGERRVTLRRVGEVSIVGALYHIPAGAHPEYVAVDILSVILAADESGRIYKDLVKTKRAANVYGIVFSLHDPGIMMMSCEVAQGNDPQIVMEGLLESIDNVAANGVDETEVDRARQRLMKQWELGASDSSRIAIQLSEWASQGDWRLYFLYRDRLENVTAADVNRAAQTYLSASNRTIGIFLPTEKPERAVIPSTPDLAEMIGDYKGRGEIQVGEAFDVSPLNVEARTERMTLPSGLKVALLPKRTRGGVVNAQLTLRYGTADSLQGYEKACELLPRLMMRGTKQLSRLDLRDALDRYGANLSATGRVGSLTLSLKTKRDNVAPVLDIVRQILREPRLDPTELELLKAESTARAEKMLSDPSSLANNALMKRINPYEKPDPRYVPSPEENLRRIADVDDQRIRSLYENFLGSRDGELSVVGDFDAQEFIKAVESGLTDWQPKEAYSRLEKTGDAGITYEVETILTPDKANAMYFAGTIFPMRDDSPDYPAMVIGNFILGGGSLSSRLGDRVRQEEGLSYGVGSGFNASSLDERSAFYIYAITNPQNMPKLQDVIRTEVDKLLTGGVTEEEVANAIQGYLQSREVGRTNDASLAQALESTSFSSRTMQFTADVEKAITGLTKTDVDAALRKYISFDRLYVVEAGDLAKE